MICVLLESVRNYSKILIKMLLFVEHGYISVTITDFELKFRVCNPNIPVEGSVSQNFDLGLSSYFMSKNG